MGVPACKRQRKNKITGLCLVRRIEFFFKWLFSISNLQPCRIAIVIGGKSNKVEQIKKTSLKLLGKQKVGARLVFSSREPVAGGSVCWIAVF